MLTTSHAVMPSSKVQIKPFTVLHIVAGFLDISCALAALTIIHFFSPFYKHHREHILLLDDVICCTLAFWAQPQLQSSMTHALGAGKLLLQPLLLRRLFCYFRPWGLLVCKCLVIWLLTHVPKQCTRVGGGWKGGAPGAAYAVSGWGRAAAYGLMELLFGYGLAVVTDYRTRRRFLRDQQQQQQQQEGQRMLHED